MKTLSQNSELSSLFSLISRLFCRKSIKQCYTFNKYIMEIVILLTRKFLFITLLILSFSFKLVAKKVVLTPQNVVKVMFDKVTRADFKGLLPYLAKKEKRYYKKIIKSMSNNYRFKLKVMKQSYSINSYKELKKEIYNDLAVVQYAWEIPYYKYVHGLKKKFKKEIKLQSLLQKQDGKWYIIDTKSIKPKDEIGMKRRINKKKTK